MNRSDAMDLESGIFKLHSARSVAQSLKKSAEASHRRKLSPFRSAMSMLNFEINRSGTNLSAERRRVLNQAKIELRKAFDRAVTLASYSFDWKWHSNIAAYYEWNDFKPMNLNKDMSIYHERIT